MWHRDVIGVPYPMGVLPLREYESVSEAVSAERVRSTSSGVCERGAVGAAESQLSERRRAWRSRGDAIHVTSASDVEFPINIT